MTTVRTYHPRRGRLSDRHRDALDRLSRHYAIAGDEVRRGAPLVLEIGSGMGEAVLAMAAADPGRDYLAALVEQHGLANLRVESVDALELLRDRLPEASLAAIHVFFPDPWPKARHHKRRLIQPVHVALLASRLEPGGSLHCATDDAGYAGAMLATLSAEPSLRNTATDSATGFAPRPPHRPRTKFELRAEQDGREVFDLVFSKR
jgi:tRNA (guanine-N7-)-methyltransferase